MLFENHLTAEDMERAAKLELTPPVLAGAYMSQLNAIEAFWADIVHPFVHHRDSWPPRQLAVATLSDRAIGHGRVVPRLNSLVYQQTVTSAERSVIELWLDIRLLHQNVIADGAQRLFAFGEYQKLLSAKRTDRFFLEYPELDESPSAALPHRGFIAKEGARIDAQTQKLWAKPPDHWSGMKLKERAKAVGPEAQLKVAHGYDMRNFASHTGVAGVLNVPSSTFELIYNQSVANIADCTMDILKVLGVELDVSKTVAEYDYIVEYFSDLHSFCLCDALLRGAGEPQRLFFRSGPWGVKNV